MDHSSQGNALRRVMVGTDRSKTAGHAVQWAAAFADRYGAELYVVQIIVPEHPATTEFGVAEKTKSAAAHEDLVRVVRPLAGHCYGRTVDRVDSVHQGVPDCMKSRAHVSRFTTRSLNVYHGPYSS